MPTWIICVKFYAANTCNPIMGVCFGDRTLGSTALLALVVTLQLISWTSSTVDAAITVKGVKCGSKFCKLDQFCSPHDGHCDDCSSICNQTTHNFDLQMCTAQCQGENWGEKPPD